MKKVFITTLGCKVNQYESASFSSGFIKHGYVVVKDAVDADIVVINSCAVTAKAGTQSRQLIRQLTRKNPTCRLIITGCYAEADIKTIQALDELTGRDYTIIGNARKDKLVQAASSPDLLSGIDLFGDIMHPGSICDLPVETFGERTRAYLRVQDGCQNFCSYCIVPFTRGPSRSLSLHECLRQAESFAGNGFKEIVLTGIHLGYYGSDFSTPTNIFYLIDKITAEFPEIRFRISSLEPNEISDDLLTLMTERGNLMPHLHIPLQSGNDHILQLMNRKYDTPFFADVIGKCRKKLPDMAIGIDILAGFPGETDDLFESTCEFVSALGCTYLHVFPYSVRPGTAAADFPGKVDKTIKAERVARLREIGIRKRDEFYSNQVGKVLPVLVEGKRDSKGRLYGFSDNYVSVHFDGDDTLKNSVVDVRLQTFEDSCVAGEVSSGS